MMPDEDLPFPKRLVWRIPEDWWENAFQTDPPSERDLTMLMVVAYDISDERRLRRVAQCCEDFGGRVQYSVFEIRLNAEQFEKFWERLNQEIDPAVDRIIAYRVCNECARKIRLSGQQERTDDPPPVHVF